MKKYDEVTRAFIRAMGMDERDVVEFTVDPFEAQFTVLTSIEQDEAGIVKRIYRDGNEALMHLVVIRRDDL